MMQTRLSMVFLGMLLWVMSLHAGRFTSAEVPSSNVYTDYQHELLFTHDFQLLQPHIKLRITEKDLNKTINFAYGLINHLKRLEINLCSSEIHVKPGTPSHGQFIDSEPEAEALRQGHDALVAMKATMQLMIIHCNKWNLNAQDCAKHISKFSLKSTPLHSSCPHALHSCEKEEFESHYRSLNGLCNNPGNYIFGKSFSSYKRLLPSHYKDGIQEPRRSVHQRFDLPSPRLISTSICNHRDIVDKELTLAVMQWSQFIQHDLSHTATRKMVHSGKTIECCDSDGTKLAPRYIHPFCAPIDVPDDDIFYSKYSVECMSYVRSVPAMRSDCTLGPIEQINQATHFLDGSQIYGTDMQKMKHLRQYRKGLMNVSKYNNKNYLPISTTPTIHCQCSTSDSKCFVSGDSRVNMQPQLTAMYTLWHREHNRLAIELAILNPHWDDERLYQEARRIVNAEMQHITYDEWLPVILGKKYTAMIEKENLYSEEIDPSVSNSFATAALQFISSLMEDKLELYGEDRAVNISLNLREHFNRPNTIEKPGHLDGLIRGLATQQSQKMDMDIVQDVTNHLYRSGEYGFDMLSLDIQRGRDHGLPSYTAYRLLSGLDQIHDFTDLTDVMTLQRIESLMKVYRSPDDIDLLIGGMSERSDKDSILGPTFSYIIADQLLRTKQGDRYFYKNPNQPKPFTSAQLAEIEKVTLARIFCDNGDEIQRMQPNVFNKINKDNDVVSCLSEDIPFVNLKVWMDS